MLDAGCGTGRLTHLLAKTLSDSYVIGVDISRKSCIIAHNRSWSQKVEFLVADLAYLPFRDSSFDLIIFSEVLNTFFLMKEKKSYANCKGLVNLVGIYF